MSKSINQEHRYLEDLESSIRGTVVYRAGVPLSKRDNDTYVTAIYLQSLLLHDLLNGRSPCRKSRIIRWLKTTLNQDVLQVSDCCKDMLSWVRRYEANLGTVDYASFKRMFAIRYSFIGDYISPIKEEMEAFLTTPSPATFTVINQFLSFNSRLSLQDLDLDVQAIERYLATESRLSDSTYNIHTLHHLNEIMRQWMAHLSVEEILPSHGNGAVAGLSGSNVCLRNKYLALNLDSRLEYWLREYGGAKSFFPRNPTSDLERTCTLQCVAKSISTKRVISMEPATLQYFQHAVYREIDHYIRRHPTLRNRIHIHDASVNRLQACRGSITRLYDTIDLSDASDSVSWQLVKAVFAGTPLLRSLFATRSDSVLLPDGSKLRMKKYAPMGSALCFPIECLIFSSICEYALRLSGMHFSRDIVPYVVHGDDIVVRHELADLVVELLQECNFVVNTEKTFITNDISFRESCGGEYFQGIDVTPFRISRKFSGIRPNVHHPEMYPHYIKMANLSFLYRFRMTRLWYIHNLLSLPKTLRPEFGSNESQVNSTSYSNFHLTIKYDRRYRAEYVRCGSLKIHYELEPESDEDIRLFEWLRVTSTRLRGPSDPEDLIDVHLSAPTTKLSSRLVPKSWYYKK